MNTEAICGAFAVLLAIIAAAALIACLIDRFIGDEPDVDECAGNDGFDPDVPRLTDEDIDVLARRGFIAAERRGWIPEDLQ